MLNNMYSELILSHNQKSPHRGELTNPSRVERGHNPNCGDDLTLMVTLSNGDGAGAGAGSEVATIVDAKFAGHGCAISTAAMSIMIDLVKGKTLTEAQHLADLYLGMIKGETLTREDKRLLKDAIAFESIKDMPARVKCATLGWHCLKVVAK